MTLKDDIEQITGIKPREAWDNNFYLDLNEDKPSDEQVIELEAIVKKASKRYGYKPICMLHNQPGINGSYYTLFCSIED